MILVLTKFDEVISEALFDVARGDVLQYERARAEARANYEDSIRRRFGQDPRDVPVEVVSGMYYRMLRRVGYPTFAIALSGADLRRSYREAGRDDR